MEKRKKILLVILSILCIMVIVSSAWLVYYGKPFNRINNGMTRTDVTDIMGEPDFIYNLTKSPVMWGPTPEIPNGTAYVNLFYDKNGTYQNIWLVSPEDYSTITGKSTTSEEWVVIGKLETDSDVIYR